MIHNEASARQYIEEKKILPLIQALTTAITYSKPENPVEFLIERLTELQKGNILVCFTDNDIKAMFTVLDPFNKGTVTRAQLEGSMKNFGADEAVIPDILGDNSGPFGPEDFGKYINEGIRRTLFGQ